MRLLAIASLTALALSSLTAVAPASPTERPFSADSPWNVPLPMGWSSANRDSCTATFRNPKLTADINAAAWSHPVYRATERDPTWTVTVDGRTGPKLQAPEDLAAALPTAQQDPGTDAHVHVVDPTGRWVDEFWRARVDRSRHALHATSHTRNSLLGPGVGTGGERAYGGSAIGGLIESAELERGQIDHALAFALPRSLQALGPVWPATAQDTGADGTYLGHVPMGTRVALPPQLDLSALPLSPAGRTIAEALRRYGAIDVDSSSDFALYAEPAAEPRVAPARADLKLLVPLLQCVGESRPAPPGPAPDDVTVAGPSPSTVTQAASTSPLPAATPELRAVHVARTGTAPRKQVHLVYTLTAAASVKLTYARELPGRRHSGRCMARTRRNVRDLPCIRRTIVGIQRVAGAPGTNLAAVSTFIRQRHLRPGRYRLSLLVTWPGGRRASQHVSLTVRHP